MSKSRSETIILQGDPLYEEGKASAAISPGHIVEYGGANDIQKASTAKKNTLLRVAMENDLIGGDISTAYASGDNVRFSKLRKGDKFQGRLAASAAAVVKGDQLELAADGTLRKLTDGAPVAEAFEAVDNSAGGSEVFLIAEAI